jgi:hypothetical protein
MFAVHFVCPLLSVPVSAHRIGWPLALNETDPTAVEGETVAVKITECPTVDGLRLEVRLVVVPVQATGLRLGSNRSDIDISEEPALLLLTATR